MNEIINNGLLQFVIVFFLLFVLVTWLHERRLNAIYNYLVAQGMAMKSIQLQLDIDANLDDIMNHALGKQERRLDLLIKHLGVSEEISLKVEPDHSPEEPDEEDPETEDACV